MFEEQGNDMLPPHLEQMQPLGGLSPNLVPGSVAEYERLKALQRSGLRSRPLGDYVGPERLAPTHELELPPRMAIPPLSAKTDLGIVLWVAKEETGDLLLYPNDALSAECGVKVHRAVIMAESSFPSVNMFLGIVTIA